MFKKLISLFCITVLLSVMLTACQGSETTDSTTTGTKGTTGAQTTATTTEPSLEEVTISVMTMHSDYSDIEGIEADPVKSYIEGKLKIKLDFVAGDFEKARLLITTGQAPDIIGLFSWEGDFKTLIKDGIEESMYTELSAISRSEPERYPVLNKIFNDEDFQVFNGIYGGDREKAHVLFTLIASKPTPSSPCFNMNYMDELDLDLPTTVDDFISVLRALRAGKPEVITFGYLNRKGNAFPGELNDLFFHTHGTNASAIEEQSPGVFVDTTLNDKNKEVWELLAQLNSEGIFDPEAFSKEDYYHGTNDFATGKTAVITMALPNTNAGMYDWIFSETIKNDTSAVPEDYQMLPQPLKGEYLKTSGIAISNGIVIPKTSKNPDRALDLLEFVVSNEGQALMVAGVEGVDHTRSGDGSFTLIDQQAWNDKVSVYKNEIGYFGPFLMLVYSGGLHVPYENYSYLEAYMQSTNPVLARNEAASEAMQYAAKIVNAFQTHPDVEYTGDLSMVFMVPDDETKDIGTKLNEVKTKWFTRFFFSEVDMDQGWEEFVAEYKAAGADDYLAGYTKAVEEARALVG